MTDEGISIDANAELSRKALSLIFVKVVGSFTDVKDVHCWSIPLLILVTPSGISMDTKAKHL